MEELKGLVLNIERFAIHDGPGIRTLVFMKGCPLRCLWCSTPHSQKMAFEILHNEIQCQKCGRCAEVCPVGAITMTEDGPKFDRDLCTVCGKCVEGCLYDALEMAGKWMTVEELFREVQKDSAFYRRSGGGVTMGGGEPTMQIDFVTAFLERCKKSYMHTAIETCSFIDWERFKQVLDYLDLVYMDIKHMDDAVHKEITGVSNRRILENVRNVAKIRPLIIRVPVIPGLNDSEDNMLDTRTFAAELGSNLQRVELLPYHKLGTATYQRVGMEYKLEGVEAPSDDHMQKLKEIVESKGVKVQIGG